MPGSRYIPVKSRWPTDKAQSPREKHIARNMKIGGMGNKRQAEVSNWVTTGWRGVWVF